jgi:hypothetical protein
MSPAANNTAFAGGGVVGDVRSRSFTETRQWRAVHVKVGLNSSYFKLINHLQNYVYSNSLADRDDSVNITNTPPGEACYFLSPYEL